MNTNTAKKPIVIVGAGSWGTALALHLSRLGQQVYLWSLEKNHVLQMQKENENQRGAQVVVGAQMEQPRVHSFPADDVHYGITADLPSRD